MIKVVAVCDEARGCPLYTKGDKLEFTPPSLHGMEGAPVCSIAAGTLTPAVGKLEAGQPPQSVAFIYCGGCKAGKAWWSFEQPQQVEDPPSVSPRLLESISKLKIFSGIHAARLKRIIQLLKAKRIPNGYVLITRGKPGEAFYVVLNGEFEVVQHDENQVESTLAVLHAGDCFGEMSLMTGEPASASVRARGEATVLAVSKDDFNQMLGLAPEMALTLARILANRLARTGRWVIDELKKGLLGRLELIPPAEIIQAMNVNGQTGMLIVQNAEENVTIYLHDGQVLQAELGDKKGEEAFYRFLTWAHGNFRFEPVRKDNPVRQVQGDTVGLLLEGMRRVDEFRQTGVLKKE